MLFDLGHGVHFRLLILILVPLHGLAAPITNQRDESHKPAEHASNSAMPSPMAAFLYSSRERPHIALAPAKP
ncbi:MAG TPA: hypothetical protein DHV63_02315 [Pseudomonas sp.]|nr:hypothetical protein [Pseudomonas sp.]